MTENDQYRSTNESVYIAKMAVRNCLLIFIAIGMANCGDETALEKLLFDGNSKLLAKTFPEVLKTNAEKSFTLSSFSVFTSIAELALASEGSSHDELLNALGLPDDQSIKSVFSLIDSKLRSLKGFISANKIYVDKGYTINQDFAELSKQVFHSDVQNIDFTNTKQSAEEINAWVKEETDKNSQGVENLDTLSDSTKLLLVSANYFKGIWKNSFHPRHTIEFDFQVSSEKTNKVPFMYRKNDYNFTFNEQLKAKILEIPYEDGVTSFYILLPMEVDRVSELVEKLNDPAVLDNAFKDLKEVFTKVYIPKFKLESTISLKDALENMGVKKVLNSDEAKLDKLVKEPSGLALSDAIQKVSIEISEEGFEQTAFEYVPSYPAGYIPNFNIFFADHPFVFVVKSGQDILLTGVYYS